LAGSVEKESANRNREIGLSGNIKIRLDCFEECAGVEAGFLRS